MVVPPLAAYRRARSAFSPNITCCREDKPSRLSYAESRGGDYLNLYEIMVIHFI